MLVVRQGHQVCVGVCQLGVGGEGVGHVDVAAGQGLILQPDVDVHHVAELQAVGLTQGAEAVLPLDVVRIAAEGQLPGRGGQVAGVLQAVLLRHVGANGHGEGVVEAVQPHPGHAEVLLIFLLELGEHLVVIHALGLVVQHHHPAAGGVLRVQVKLPGLHGGLDVAGAAAHALGDLHLIAGFLDEETQHLA